MSKRTKKIVITGMLLYLLLITYIVMVAIKEEMRPNLKFNVDNAIYMFSYVQPFGFSDSFLITQILPFLVIPVFSSFYLIFIKNNNELNNVIQRIGYNTFLKKSVLKIFSAASLFSLIVELYEIILINWFYFPFAFTSNSLFLSERASFSSNSLVHLMLYILTSSIGWGIFSVLIFAIGLYISKNIIYIIIGPIVGFMTILLPILAGVNNKILVFIANLILSPALVSPGQINIASQNPPLGLLWTWIIIAVLYSLVAFLLIKLWHKKQLRGA